MKFWTDTSIACWRRQFCLSLLMFMANPGNAAGEMEYTEDQVRRHEGLLYLKGSDQKLNGVLVAKGYRRQVANGEFHGLTIFYWPDGGIKNETQFRHNAAHGSVRWYYRNGQLSYVGSRWYGREHGQKAYCYDEQGLELERCTRNAMTGGEHP